MKFDIKKWNEEAEEESCRWMDYPESSISKLFDEIEKLESIVDDYKQDYEKVTQERCPHDEVHCGCVPILRRYQRITDEELQAAKDELKIRREELKNRIKINIDVDNQRFKYKSALELIASFKERNPYKVDSRELINIALRSLSFDSERVFDAVVYWIEALKETEEKLEFLKKGNDIK